MKKNLTYSKQNINWINPTKIHLKNKKKRKQKEMNIS